MAATADNSGMTLTLALDYGGREELVRATRLLAEQVSHGKLKPSEIDETHLSNAMYTAGMPDPDLMIRTSGELRISNFLLWQLAYAELYFTPVRWPDFSRADFAEALRAFARRERRFGGLLQEPRLSEAKPASAARPKRLARVTGRR
jgi:undecaprenyl diphosphate synthase